MNKIQFVIVGVGRIGTKYSKIIGENPNAELIAAVDIDFGKRKSISKLVPFFTDISDFLAANIKADIICVCTPNGLHARHTIMFLHAGFHVICEKPIALHVADGYKMLAAEKASGKKVFAVMQNRYSPVSIWLKKLIDDKKLGKILFIQINCFWNRSQQYYTEAPWRATLELGGGPLFTQFSHFIDLMIWLTGQPEHIVAQSFNLNHQIKTEFNDSGTLTFNLENGGTGTFNYTNATFDRNLESSLTIIATKGNIKVGGQYMEKLEYVNLEKSTQIPVFDNVTTANDYQFYQGSLDKHDEFLANVIHCLQHNLAPEVGLKDGIKIVHFIEEALAAAEYKNY
ncbi:MAG: gfo/Idh/MocA family oxidoreductase [Sphingobacteriales bacterium]|nr:MAG: gfo/Idh/MocA family oxidoreductase [Sphingobacteriales bacterium]TAF79340.1 MAG: gfo/Idh/MocA family oxidoreductase [Sphingobacteriales bacterium]